MPISVDTKLVFFLGNPLRQSISTRVLNRVYEYMGLDVLRLPVEISGKENLEELLKGMRHLNLAGFNVTKPNKVEVLPYLDELDPLAQKIGAVNCVVCENRHWKGYNTDAEGFLRALQENTDCEISKSTFFCFGAGGAGRAITFGLASEGAQKIYLTDAFDSVSAELEKNINHHYAGTAESIPFSEKERITALVSQADVILNVSGIGMYPHLEETPVSKEALHAGQLAFDAAYNPKRTRFLREAAEAGCAIMNGEKMLMNCNMIGFEKICRRKAPVEKWKEIMQEESEKI